MIGLNGKSLAGMGKGEIGLGSVKPSLMERRLVLIERERGLGGESMPTRWWKEGDKGLTTGRPVKVDMLRPAQIRQKQLV